MSYARYVGKTVWPVDLAAYYPLPSAGWPAPEVVAGSALLIVTSALALWQVRARPWFAVGWAWFLGTLVPVIGLVQVGAQAMADRYTYLPSIGLFIAITWGANAAAERWGATLPLRLAAFVVGAVLAVLTWRQAGYWSDHVTLFRHTIEVTGPNPRAHAYLADGLRKAGNHGEALAEAHEAIRIDPGASRSWLYLAIIELDLGRLDDARRTLQRAVEIDPNLAFAWALYGEVETALGRPEAGERMLSEAARMAPYDAEIAERLARVRAYRASVGR